MTKAEVLEVLEINQLLFGSSFNKSLTADDVEQLAKVWLYYFGKMDGTAIKKAFLEAAKTSRFAIQPADIFTVLNAQADNMPASEQWQMLVDALPKVDKFLSWRRYKSIVGTDDAGRPIFSDGRKELRTVFDKLPPAIKREVGSAEGLRDFLEMSASELQYRYSAFERRCKDEKEQLVPLIENERRLMLNGN